MNLGIRAPTSPNKHVLMNNRVIKKRLTYFYNVIHWLMKEIKVIDESTIYINFKGQKFLLSWKIDSRGDYVSYCQGFNWDNYCYTEIGDDWREMAFICLPMKVQRELDFVKFI